MKAIKKKSYIWTKMVFWKNFVVILVKKKKKHKENLVEHRVSSIHW